MTTEYLHISDMEQQQDLTKLRRSRAARSVLIFLTILILILTIILILAFTVFKPQKPTTEIASVTLEGITPRVIFPQFKVDLNITLDLQIVVHNPNYASFKHDTGAAFLYYKGTQVVVADISPGTVPATGSEIIPSRLTLETDRFVSENSAMIKDVMAGEFEVETKLNIPGVVKVLGIFQKHVVSLSDCRIVVGVSDLKVRSRKCDNEIQL
ncbi:hypothetical protein NE237_021663 [Protea cynaroides]|uniref:Late embryogenesis abundant protein LEA-2 subgroup domain-containing protein n=1 Tax=Protea cynaroides TaxID=273540 RepID=A0A9Q0H8Y7_9MAGN|nr:hypothetical protein NE237_021663 [Protea cynaroides]